MASVHTAATNLVLDQECPVCTEKYRDPRILECGHHFCKVCLEQIAERHPQGHVTCPTCRLITKTNGKQGVEELHKYSIINDFVRHVNEACKQKDENSKFCELCSKKENIATKYCFECQLCMCEKCCINEHASIGDLEKHKTYNYSSLIFCPQHKERISIFMCHTCDKTCCAKCRLSVHKGHRSEKIEDAVQNVRSRLVDKNKSFEKAAPEDDIANQLQSLFGQTKKIQKDFTKTVAEILTSIDYLKHRVVQLEKDVNSKLETDIKQLEDISKDYTTFVKSKKQLQAHISVLLKDISDQELMYRQAELPEYEPGMAAELFSTTNYKVEIPDLSSLNQLQEKLREYKTSLGIKYTSHEIKVVSPQPYKTKVTVPISDAPLKSLKKIKSFNDGVNVYGLAVNIKKKRLFVRRQNKYSPITVYDYTGNKLSVLGAGVHNISDADCRCIAIDTKRDLLLLPTSKGTIIRMDDRGKVKDTITVTDKRLNGICYTEEDKYVTSSVQNKSVFLIDPSSGCLISDFTPNTKLSGPYDVSSGMFDDQGSSIPVIFVSCHSGHCIKVLDYNGRLVHVYGTEGEDGDSLSQLSSPEDTCVGPGNQILVADKSNKRIVTFDRRSGTNTGQVLLGKSDITSEGWLYHLEYDPHKGKLFVGYDNGDIDFYQG